MSCADGLWHKLLIRAQCEHGLAGTGLQQIFPQQKLSASNSPKFKGKKKKKCPCSRLTGGERLQRFQKKQSRRLKGMQFPREERLTSGSKHSCHPLHHTPLPGLKLHCSIIRRSACTSSSACRSPVQPHPRSSLPPTSLLPPCCGHSAPLSQPSLGPASRADQLRRTVLLDPPELVKFISSMTPSGTESLNFTRDA